MEYILIIVILYGIGIIVGLIEDWLVLRGFKIALKEYNELYPNYNIPIPQTFKELRALKNHFEDFTCYNDLLHYHLTITNFHYDEENEDETKTN